MKYTMSCPVPGCPEKAVVEAGSDEEAITKILEMGKAHAAAAHKDLPQLPDDTMRGVISVGMQKG